MYPFDPKMAKIGLSFNLKLLSLFLGAWPELGVEHWSCGDSRAAKPNVECNANYFLCREPQGVQRSSCPRGL